MGLNGYKHTSMLFKEEEMLNDKTREKQGLLLATARRLASVGIRCREGFLCFWMIAAVLAYWLRFYSPWVGWIPKKLLEAQTAIAAFFSAVSL